MAEHIAAIDVTLGRLLAEAQLLFLTPPVVAASSAYMLSKGIHDSDEQRCEELRCDELGCEQQKGEYQRCEQQRCEEIKI